MFQTHLGGVANKRHPWYPWAVMLLTLITDNVFYQENHSFTTFMVKRWSTHCCKLRLQTYHLTVLGILIDIEKKITQYVVHQFSYQWTAFIKHNWAASVISMYHKFCFHYVEVQLKGHEWRQKGRLDCKLLRHVSNKHTWKEGGSSSFKNNERHRKLTCCVTMTLSRNCSSFHEKSDRRHDRWYSIMSMSIVILNNFHSTCKPYKNFCWKHAHCCASTNYNCLISRFYWFYGRLRQ